MLIEGVGQFLASSLQLLPQGEAVKHNSILKTEMRKQDQETFLTSFCICITSTFAIINLAKNPWSRLQKQPGRCAF